MPNKFIPWDTSHYEYNWCVQKAEELRQSGRYKAVKVGSILYENGKKYGKIYVQKLGPHTAHL